MFDFLLQPYFGKPLLLWLGLLDYLLLLFAMSIPVMKRKNIKFIDFEWHPRLAALAMLIATLLLIASFIVS